jgi:hypothetical protein
MALQVNIPMSAIGISFGAAYVRIRGFRGDKNKIFANLATYANADARQNEMAPIAQEEIEIDMASLQGPLLPALYGYLKLRPEFLDAIDC